jgi:FkbM family methyltransferase
LKNKLKVGLLNILFPFLKGVCRHMRTIPKVVFFVRGWPALLADRMGLRHQPYQLQTTKQVLCELRPGTSDWWIFLEVFVFEIYQRVRNEICQSEVIIDIGANVGYFALYASSLNPKAQIHAFEPFPGNSDRLAKNLSLNKNHQISLHTAAVADKAGKATLFFTPGDDSGCSLVRQQGQSCPVMAVGINDLLNVCGATKCDLLKMDCEGGELAIFSFILPDQLAKIQNIIMEYHDPAHLNPLKDVFIQAGFECEVFAKINTLCAFRK